MIAKVYQDAPFKTYKTEENATKAFHAVCTKLGITEMGFVIAADNGRFFPIALPRESEVQNAIALAFNGMMMIRR